MDECRLLAGQTNPGREAQLAATPDSITLITTAPPPKHNTNTYARLCYAVIMLLSTGGPFDLIQNQNWFFAVFEIPPHQKELL